MRSPSPLPRRPLAVQLSTALLWLTGLSPAFFAVVVWARTAPHDAHAVWGQPRTEVALTTWRLYAGSGYAALVVGLALVVVALALAAGRPDRPRYGGGLLAAALLMYACPVAAGLLGGHGGAFGWRLWVPPLLVLALWLAPPPSPVRLLRGVLRVYVWGSLAVFAVFPSWAVTPSFNDNFQLDWLTPGGRLAGLTNHPIGLGVLAALAVTVEFAPAYRTRRWQLHCAAAALVLVMSQSRTAWLAAALGLPLLYRREAVRRVHPVLVRSLAAGTALCAALLVPGVLERAGTLWDSDEITTLHGRTVPWQVALTAFRDNVWVGYGPELFFDRASPNRGAFDHAHNQLFQTLGTSGLLGAAGLALFAAAVVLFAARGARVTSGLTWCVALTTVVLCVPEAPLRGSGFSPYQLLAVTLFVVLCDAARARAELATATVRVPQPARTPESTPVPAATTPGLTGPPQPRSDR
ncbi:O-antigen ligase family protein [Streptomyces sp. NPDC001941]|uniref:O-antigen ligase family protein n=1 Tax=Streptomyces sp. NPDC001941 TaxID=3154659 RepID=UPI00331F74E5